MREFTFLEELEEATCFPDLAARLGRLSLGKESELESMLAKGHLHKLCEAVTEGTAACSLEGWERVIAEPAALRSEVGDEFADLLEFADANHPLDCLGVLRGFCRGALMVYFERLEGELVLEEGMPVPLAAPRPLPKERFELTPLQRNLGKNAVIKGFGVRLFEFRAGEKVQVVLDFSKRERFDELMLTKSGRLPRIATLHPPGSRQLKVGTKGQGRFFDAAPEEWVPGEIQKMLEGLADVEIAVLPELSLPDPDALDGVVANIDAPPLIVAGSAHLRQGPAGEGQLRVNESVIYLDRERVGAHRKCTPFDLGELDGVKFDPPLSEDLSEEQKILRVYAGNQARFAVVICADLNDEYVPQKLIAAGVNMLFVPSYTPKTGAFNGPIADLASRRQAICVIANAPPEPAAPFRVLAAVPRPNPGFQTAAYPLAGETPTDVAVFDPGLDLKHAVEWR